MGAERHEARFHAGLNATGMPGYDHAPSVGTATTIQMTEIYEAGLQRGRQIGERRSAADGACARETINSAILDGVVGG